MNGPVFPIQDMNNHLGPIGLTLRDYFAAHAPAEPWVTFHVRMPPQPEEPNPDALLRGCNDELRRIAHSWRLDPCFDLVNGPDRLDLLPYAEAYQDYWQAMDAWNRSKKTARLTQWPWFYADAMLEARGS